MSGSITNMGTITDETNSTSSDNTDSASSGTRDPTQTPFASDSVFNLPLGSDAQWEYNSQLANADVFVNTVASGYNENIFTGSADDPLVTVTNDAAAGGSPSTYYVHIPTDAEPATGGDSTFTVDDTTSGTWYSFGGFQWTGSDTATVSQASAEPDNGSGITQDGSDFDEGVGTLRESDLQAGTIDHMLRIEVPTSMVESYTDSITDLAPYAWPQTEEDGFAINGDGGTPYSGTIPYGVTVGIPQGTPEPADVAANAGANMLWQALEDHGAMIRDTTSGSGNTIVVQADQNVDPNDPLVQGMDQYGAQIMAATQILTNQGPDSVNGGGTPVVPLDPPVSDGSSSSTSSSNDSSATSSGDSSSSSSASDTATITSQSLSSGDGSSGSSSGMSFVSPTDSSGSTSDTSSSGSSSDTGTGSAAVVSTTPSTSDFTPPATPPTAPSTSNLTGGRAAWLASHPGIAAYYATHHG